MKLGLIGAEGRMGKSVLALSQEIEVVSIVKNSDISSLLHECDVALDLSSKEAVRLNLPKILQAKKPYVIGVTGLDTETLSELSLAASQIPIFLSANFSEGIGLVKKIIDLLPKGSYAISETHHARKKDAPSGTALELANRLPSPSKISSIREGDAVGLHKITLHLEFETLEIIHEAFDRKAFARGALQACRFLLDKPPGLYRELH